MALTTASKIADYLLCLSAKHGDLLTPLKLQKLVYYADAWHLALRDNALIEEDFEAWVHGPVVRNLYYRFKEYKWKPITENIELPKLPLSICKYLHDFYAFFGKFTAIELEQMTHQETPWIEARKGLSIDAECTNCISKETMKHFYKNMSLNG